MVSTGDVLRTTKVYQTRLRPTFTQTFSSGLPPPQQCQSQPYPTTALPWTERIFGLGVPWEVAGLAPLHVWSGSLTWSPPGLPRGFALFSPHCLCKPRQEPPSGSHGCCHLDKCSQCPPPYKWAIMKAKGTTPLSSPQRPHVTLTVPWEQAYLLTPLIDEGTEALGY